MMIRNLIMTSLLVLGTTPALAQDRDAAIEAMNDYMMFSGYEDGIILPEQIDREVFENVLFVDTRDPAQFARETIPGAVNIEWREVLDRIDEIPEEQKTILFCNTGTLSSMATFALRTAGRKNVVVLQTGIDGWRDWAAYKPE
ncbi:MAG: rhodanese-like domain-containing protein [Thioclava marina]|jgi:Rhodanese-related sulfurtransferase|nr:rhodanese-like domain-containing protein [Thioclava marina]MBD3802290.1 rhodanese-like domain-containing protein [Thioclava sp.]OOY28405.1 sulfurtransferase [Thioclava sp. L04-15]